MHTRPINSLAGGAGAWRQGSLLWPMDSDMATMAVECGRTGLLIVDEALSHIVVLLIRYTFFFASLTANFLVFENLDGLKSRYPLICLFRFETKTTTSCSSLCHLSFVPIVNCLLMN